MQMEINSILVKGILSLERTQTLSNHYSASQKLVGRRYLYQVGTRQSNDYGLRLGIAQTIGSGHAVPLLEILEE